MPLGEEGSTQNDSKDKFSENGRTINGIGLLAKLGIDLGVSPVDHQTLDKQESLLDNVVFEADDYTINTPQKSLFLNIGNKNCHLEVTNILPIEYMPMKSSTFDEAMGEEEYRRKYEENEFAIPVSGALSGGGRFFRLRQREGAGRGDHRKAHGSDPCVQRGRPCAVGGI